MKNELRKQRVTTIFILFCCLYVIVILNLYRIQIKNYQFFQELGQKQYSTLITIPTPRASIVDRHGNLIAMNKPCISAYLVPTECYQDKDVRAFLRQHFPDAFYRLQEHSTNSFMFVKRRLTTSQQELIKNINIAAIALIQEESRYYPIEALGTILGITDIDNKGLFGIELACDQQLAGSPTTVQLEKDARSGMFYFNKETKIAGTNGIPVKLTIDSTAQFLVAEELLDTMSTWTACEGAVIVMDPKTGDIIVAASKPDFDPNHTEILDMATTKNRCITERYELGSVIKVFAALAALQEEVVTPDEIIDCKNATTAYVAGRKVNTVHENGAIPFWQVIAESNNIGTATVTFRLGTKLYDHYVRMGFLESTGIGLPGEQSGFINHPNNWSKQSILSLSYGYEIAITILQLAQAIAMIANGGFMIHPRLILEPSCIQKTAPQERLYSPQAIAAIKDILEKTTTVGTAKKARIKGYTVMCKTGTANTLSNGVYNQDINLFTASGIVQKNDYQRVIVTFVKAPGKKLRYASTIAVPLFERVAEKILIHDRIV